MKIIRVIDIPEPKKRLTITQRAALAQLRSLTPFEFLAEVEDEGDRPG